MKYIIALFTSKVVTDTQGRPIYVDPISKNGYLLKGKLAKQKNILPIRFVFALFAFFVMYLLLPTLNDINMLPVWGALSFIGLIWFEISLYKKYLPNCSIYPNYQVKPSTKDDMSVLKRRTLIVAYFILLALLAIYALQQKDIIIGLITAVLGIVSVLRLQNLLNK